MPMLWPLNGAELGSFSAWHYVASKANCSQQVLHDEQCEQAARYTDPTDQADAP